VESLYGSLAGFVGFYTVLLVVEMMLMVRFARQGRVAWGRAVTTMKPLTDIGLQHICCAIVAGLLCCFVHSTKE
jgi:hypothetical protein